MADPWIGFLNEEVARRPALERSLGKEFLRQSVMDRAANMFPFPLEVSFRAVVTGRTRVDGEEYLVLGPAELTGEALRVLGGVLVPKARDLYPGAVVDVVADLDDPDTYQAEKGMLAKRAELNVIVPLEP